MPENTEFPFGRPRVGKAFLEKYPDDPWVKAVQTPEHQARLRILGALFAAVNKVQQDATRRASRTMVGTVADMMADWKAVVDAELKQVYAEAKIEDDRFRAEWQQAFGEPYPEKIEDWERWCSRLDAPGRYVPAEKVATGDWMPGDLLPFIEGYLLKLKDEVSERPSRAMTGEQTEDRTDQAAKNKIQTRTRCPRGESPRWILGYICRHHEYDGGSVVNWTPIKEKEIAEGLNGRVSAGTISKWFKKEFGGYAQYVGCCNKETLLPILQRLRGDLAEFFVDPESFLENRADPRAPDPARD